MTALVRKAGSATEPGEVTITAQIWAGEKTFDINISSANADSIVVKNSAVAASGVDVSGIRFQYNTAIPAAIRSVLVNNGTGQSRLAFFVNDLSAITSTSGLKEYLSIAHLGACTLGGSSGLGTTGSAYHKFYGSIVGDATTWSVGSSDIASFVSNSFLDGAGTRKAIASGIGYSRLNMLKPATTGATAFSIVANGTDTQTLNSALVSTNQLTLVSATASGVWTVGDTTNTAFPGNNIVGKKDAVAVAAGYVGEKKSVYNQTATHYGATATGAGTVVTTTGLGILQTSSTVPIKITLTPGLWQIKAKCEVTQTSKVSTSTGITLFQLSISTNTTATTAGSGFERNSNRAIVGDATNGTNFDMIVSVIENINTGADYFLVQNTQGSGTGMIINNVCMEAVRM